MLTVSVLSSFEIGWLKQFTAPWVWFQCRPCFALLILPLLLRRQLCLVFGSFVRSLTDCRRASSLLVDCTVVVPANEQNWTAVPLLQFRIFSRSQLIPDQIVSWSLFCSLAQLVARRSHNPKIVGSSPLWYLSSFYSVFHRGSFKSSDFTLRILRL